MAEALQDLLAPHQKTDASALAYLTYLAEQQSDVLKGSEPQLLSQASHSLLLAVQALSKRSHKPVGESAASHASLRQTLPILAQRAADLSQAVPRLDSHAEHFSSAFGKASENKLLARRKEALLLLRNSERLVDVMEMPLLLTTAVSTAPVNYSSTLELYAHVRRLASLYPNSPIVSSVLEEADAAIRQMAADLVGTLKTPSLKLAAAVRTMGWLKRIVPDMVTGASAEDALPAVFLVCRLATLLTTLEALEPLRELADEERRRQDKAANSWSGGQQTERYLKRFIEIFREQSFSIVSVFKSINTSFAPHADGDDEDPLSPLPSPMASFPLHLVGMLLETLRIYLPTVKDQASRESILTQVLYCAGSLGRLGSDFGMLLAATGVGEWVELVKRHRLLAGRLESVIGDYRGSHKTQPVAMGVTIATPSAQQDEIAASTTARPQRASRPANSGLGSGVASAIILQPLDLLKTRVQQSGHSSLTTTFGELRQSSSLVLALWRGTVPSALRTGFGSALYFTSLNAIRQHAQRTGILGHRIQTQSGSSALPSLSNSANLVSGAVARTFAGFVLMPLTVIKVRFESSLYSYPSLMTAAADIRRTSGWRGFFSGFGATALRDAPYAGMYVLFYEILKKRFGSLVMPATTTGNAPGKMQATLASSVNFTSAMLAGGACSVVSNPFDAVKTRIQLQPQLYRNIWHAWYKMVTQEGVRSLWDGLALRMSRKALSSALAWTVYEELIRRAGAM
ncbi:mitochondrial carrier domain-containing protein [Dactylonectria macrodidyma]|uniref:Mitochondrial glycine transporter n=1 Tax=Dactylonectria macrodidyma TaxID=307937 RepID=A0A9P9IWW2_9HYPO|nr:mitochondrial carrier domain-containing protein [Dactylonectria macrodidyma]